MTMVSMINCCKLIGGDYNNNQGPSIRVPTTTTTATTTTSCNLHFHKTQPRSSLLRCRASSRFSPDVLSLAISHNLPYSLPDDLVDKLVYECFCEHALSIVFMIIDRDGQLLQKLDELTAKLTEKTLKKVVLKEILPLLIDNAHLCISSRLVVCSNLKETFLKQMKCEQEKFEHHNTDPNVLNAIRCCKVVLDVSFISSIDLQLTKIHTREELKVLLRHLMSMKGVMNASALCLADSVSKEKKTALEEYSHITRT